MTDPGWDIPGVPRDTPPGADAPAAADGPGPSAAAWPASDSARRGKRGRKARAGSVSASSGLSAGAFAPLRDGGSVAAAWPASSLGTATADTDPDSSESASNESGSSAASGVDFARSGTTASSQPAGPASVSYSSGIDFSRSADSPGAETIADSVDVTGPVQALAYLSKALDFLAHADAAEWAEGVQADCLRALAVAESQQAAAHASVLSAFSVPGGGLAGDGHRSPRVWLSWQTGATRLAAAAKVAWMRRQQAHPLVAAALAGGMVSLSWAYQICAWTDRLPAEHRDAADAELLAAAAGGAALSDLAGIAEELIREHARPDEDGDGDDGFEDRSLRLDKTLDGAGRLEGNLSPRATAAAEAVLGALSQPRGPEDTRTAGQRLHDGFEEAMLRLLAAAGLLPQRAGQPVRLELEITLEQLADGGAGSPAGPGSACDAIIQPVITGMTDHGLLARLTDPGDPQWREDLQAAMTSAAAAAPYGDELARAVALLSGPRGRAAWLRRRATGIPVTPVSLPLDIAAAVDTIPVHLRRAVRTRDKHCRFPGCDLPAAGCEVHHIKPRKDGGRHTLTNLVLMCRFHHLIVIHRWGWQFTLHPDGTTTAISPDGTKTLHSHPPPEMAA